MTRPGQAAAVLAAIVVLCGAAAACAGSQPAPAGTGTPSPAQPSAPPAEFTVCTTPTVTCAGQMKTEPAVIVLSADGSALVRGLTWSGWGTATAQGTGTLERDDCTPNCAQGTFTGYPATVSLSSLTPYGNGKQAYATMVVNAPAAANGSYDYQNLVP